MTHSTYLGTALAVAAFLSIPSRLSAQSYQDFGTVAVGSSSTASVTLTFSSGQLSAKPNVTMQYGIEFASGAATCNAGFTSCTVPVTFTPQYVGLRQDAVVAGDANGNVLQTRVLHGTGLGSQTVMVPGIINQISLIPNTVSTYDQFGNLYFVGFDDPQIFVQAAGTTQTTLVAGNGTVGYSGDAGRAIDAELSYPSALVLDGVGNLYISDSDVIRKVNLTTGIITTIAGTFNQPGSTGDGGPSTQALINSPSLLAADAQGNLYFVESSSSAGPVAVREISASTSNIDSLLRSTGILGGIAADSAGNLFIANTAANQIDKIIIASSAISVYAGTGTAGYSGDGGPAASARLSSPLGLATDISGNVYVADAGNNVIRRIDKSTGFIFTVAGGGTSTTWIGGPATSATLFEVNSVLVTATGDMIIGAAGFYYRVSSSDGALAFGSVKLGSSSTQQLLVSDIGSADYSVTDVDLAGAEAAPYAQTNNCGTKIAAGKSCTVNITFTPETVGAASADLVIAGGAQPAIASLNAVGQGTPQLSISPSALTFTAPEQTSVTASATLTNTGNDVLHFQNQQLQSPSTPFTVSLGCSGSLNPGQTCLVSVSFNASQPGQFSNALVFTDDAPNSPQTLTLTGTASAIPIVSVPSYLNLGSQAPGFASAPTWILLQNYGDAPLVVQGIGFSTSSPDFRETNDCATPVPARQSCAIWVTYAPGANAPNNETAFLQISDNAPSSPQLVELTGTLEGWAQSRLWVDNPPSGGTLSGTTTLSGWAVYDYAAISQVSLWVDGQPIGQPYVGGYRPDVCNLFPKDPACPNVGWSLAFDTTKFSDGKHQLVVTATPSPFEAVAPTTSIAVPFTVSNLGTPSATHVWIDQPNNSNAPFSGIAGFKGWALDDNAAIQSVTLAVDNLPLQTASYGGSRPDVCNLYPGRPGCPNVGWNASVDTTQIPDGKHILAVTAQTADGRYRTITAPFTVANASTSPVHVWIDVPAQGSSPANGTLVASGWAFDTDATMNNVVVSVDGTHVESSMFLSRPDVCAAFSNPPGCPNLGWNALIDTTQFPDGIHTFQIVATSSDGHHLAATRQFTISNSGDIAADAINGWIDNPNANSGPLSGLVNVSGWAVDHLAPIDSVVLSVDSQPFSTITLFTEREDVCVLLPAWEGCPNVGWQSSFSLDTTTLPDGPHTLTMLATAADGHRVFRTAPFSTSNSSMWAANGEGVWVDTPAQNATVSGDITLRGWAINRTAFVTGVSILVDGQPFGNAQYGLSRPDVCALYPSSSNCPNVGWTYSLDTRLLTNGTHVIWILETNYGVSMTGTRTITVANNMNGSLHAWIDQPAANAQYSGMAQFKGWAVDDSSTVSTVQATVDGLPVGTAFYGTNRSDVCANLYPGRPGCPNVGWTMSLDTTQFIDGAHIFAVTGRSSGGDEVTISTAFQISN